MAQGRQPAWAVQLVPGVRRAIDVAPPSMGFQSEPKWGLRPIATAGASGDCSVMSQIRSVRAHSADESKRSTVGSAERHAGVTDTADPATRERDEVEDCGVGSFPASDPPGWWSGG
jgi:hypothetical protein